MQKKLALLKTMSMELTHNAHKMTSSGTISFSLTLVFLGLLFYSCAPEKQDNPPKKKIDSTSVVKEIGPKILPDSLLKFHLLGKCDFNQDTCFIIVPTQFCNRKIYLQKEVCEKFIEMHQAAKKDSISIIINSGARNFYAQKSIWDRKWRASNRKVKEDTSAQNIEKNKKIALQILLYCSMPSTSRHHWGTDIDIHHFNGNNYFSNGKGLKEYQ